MVNFSFGLRCFYSGGWPLLGDFTTWTGAIGNDHCRHTVNFKLVDEKERKIDGLPVKFPLAREIIVKWTAFWLWHWYWPTWNGRRRRRWSSQCVQPELELLLCDANSALSRKKKHNQIISTEFALFLLSLSAICCCERNNDWWLMNVWIEMYASRISANRASILPTLATSCTKDIEYSKAELTFAPPPLNPEVRRNQIALHFHRRKKIEVSHRVFFFARAREGCNAKDQKEIWAHSCSALLC